MGLLLIVGLTVRSLLEAFIGLEDEKCLVEELFFSDNLVEELSLLSLAGDFFLAFFLDRWWLDFLFDNCSYGLFLDCSAVAPVKV